MNAWILIARDLLSHSLFTRLRGSLSPSLIAQLIPLGLLEAGAQCAPYKLYFSNRFLSGVLAFSETENSFAGTGSQES